MVVDLEPQISNVGRPYSADSPHFRWFGAYFALIRRIQPALRALPVRLQAQSPQTPKKISVGVVRPRADQRTLCAQKPYFPAFPPQIAAGARSINWMTRHQ
jgi:hypothetical protein